jgi:hypothetical protein
MPAGRLLLEHCCGGPAAIDGAPMDQWTPERSRRTCRAGTASPRGARAPASSSRPRRCPRRARSSPRAPDTARTRPQRTISAAHRPSTRTTRAAPGRSAKQQVAVKGEVRGPRVMMPIGGACAPMMGHGRRQRRQRSATSFVDPPGGAGVRRRVLDARRPPRPGGAGHRSGTLGRRDPPSSCGGRVLRRRQHGPGRRTVHEHDHGCRTGVRGHHGLRPDGRRSRLPDRPRAVDAGR